MLNFISRLLLLTILITYPSMLLAESATNSSLSVVEAAKNLKAAREQFDKSRRISVDNKIDPKVNRTDDEIKLAIQYYKSEISSLASRALPDNGDFHQIIAFELSIDSDGLISQCKADDKGDSSIISVIDKACGSLTRFMYFGFKEETVSVREYTLRLKFDTF